MINSNERIIKHKIGLLNLAEELGNVSQACKMMGPVFVKEVVVSTDHAASRSWLFSA